MWLCMGQEMLADEGKVVAARAASQGVTVQFEDYEAMPHVFAMLLPTLASSNRCMRSWGNFCRRCVEEPDSVKTNGTYIAVKSGEEKSVDVDKVSSITDEEAREHNRDAKGRRIKAFEKSQTIRPKSIL